MKVLANAYDWLLFLTDAGLAEFVTTLLLKPKPKYRVVRDAFISSYEEGKKANVFTKQRLTRMLTMHYVIISLRTLMQLKNGLM